MILYGIRHKETVHPIGISIFSNGDAEFCNAAGAMFDNCSDAIYMVTDRETAEKALTEDPDWYNASLERPQWPRDFKPDDYEVFTITI